MKLKVKISIIVLVIFALLGSFGLGYFTGEIQHEGCTPEECEIFQPPGEVDLSLFWEVWNTLDESYVDQDQIREQEMIYGAISGMVKSLGDPYTSFMKPKNAETFRENISGEFEGVGMEITIKDDQLQVVSPLEKTPAERAGIQAGDKILAVNGTSTDNISITEAVNLIRGPKGSAVTLTIGREGWSEPKPIEIIRDTNEIPSLKWEMKEDNIAYLRLYQFSEKASSDFRKAALEILNSPTEKIILDLRNNPGGSLRVAQDIAGWFLKRGEAVAIEDFGGKRKNITYEARGPELLMNYEVVVLINKGSASGAEILAGALRDNRGAQLIGQTSFGKGSVQELKRLSGGSSLKVTVAKWLTPNGASVSKDGLEPDIKVETEPKDYGTEGDDQLKKAIEILKE